MEKMIEKYNDLLKIHAALGIAIDRFDEAKGNEIADHETYEERRDSVIKRFELSYDLLWKYLREYVAHTQGLLVDSPRKVFQLCFQYGLVSTQEGDGLRQMVESRNQTAHVYDVDLANDIAAKIHEHYQLIHTLVTRLVPQKK
jgi:nucleotidyltransferase substrate binding protein (TIGR01987 family)